MHTDSSNPSKRVAGQYVFWLVKHAHECDAYMRGGAVSSELTLPDAPIVEKEDTPIVFRPPAGISLSHSQFSNT